MSTKCLGYEWIGQALCHCNNCGRPIWEHDHDRVAGTTPFSEMGREPIPLSARAITHLRWKYTMQVDPGYCIHHTRSEYADMTSSEIGVWLNRLQEWRHER